MISSAVPAVIKSVGPIDFQAKTFPINDGKDLWKSNCYFSNTPSLHL